MNLEFVINSWAAYAPGLVDESAWAAWSAQPHPVLGSAVPDVQHVPALTRRRLSALGRMAVHVTHTCQRGDTLLPTVFASRYGDAERSISLLDALAQDEALSPTTFGLSVHNAIGATHAIAHGDRAHQIAIAGGAASAAAGVVEAVALLDDGAPEALLVCYDAPLPGDYAVFADETPSTYAWAWRLRRPAPGESCLSLDADAAPDADEDIADHLPFGLGALRFALSDDAQWQRRCGATRWTWRRCHA